jgi:hypothetical protein
MRSRALALFAVVSLAACTTPPQPRPAAATPAIVSSAAVAARPPAARPTWTGRLPGGTVDLDVKDEPIEGVLAEIGRQRGFPVIVEGGAPERVSLSVVGAPWRSIVDWLCRVGKLRVATEKGVLVLASTPHNKLCAENADAASWFRLLAQHAGKSIIMPGNLHATIDAHLEDVDFEVALAATAANAGYVVVDGDGQLVVDRAKR